MRLDAQKVLAQNVGQLLKERASGSRLDLSRRIGVGDGTLGRIVYGTGNPTVETVERIAHAFSHEAWELLRPMDGAEVALEQLMSLSTPRSAAALARIQTAAERGELTETDLLLLQRIAERFME